MSIATTTRITNAEVATVLADARWLILDNGWRQYVAGSVKEGFSADGALLAAAVPDTDTPARGEHRALHMAARRVFMRAVGGFEPGPWNDVSGRSWDQVHAAFLDAEQLARTGAVS